MATKELIAEIDGLLKFLEASIPASPAQPSNEKLAKSMQKDASDYFKKLEQALDFNKLESIYYKNVGLSEAMTPADWKAEYKRGTPHWAKDMEPSVFAKDFAKLMKKHKVDNVLEVGCGNGRDSILFAKSGFEVTSIDIVPKAVELAKTNAGKAKEDINFKVASVEKLPFDDASYGAVFTLSVLHSTNLKKSLPEIHRVLKIDSVAFVYIYGDTQFENGKKTEDTIGYEDYLNYLKSLGFKVLKSYRDNEKDFDSFGEKHHIYVVLLEKVK